MEITNFKGNIDFITADCVKEPETLLQEAVNILESHQVDYWLSFGSTLGFYVS